jgi:hypothetical protein
MPAIRRSRWLVYLLRCRDGSLYCGISNDLPKRLKAHAAGKASRIHPQPASRGLGLQRAPKVQIGSPQARGGNQEAAPGQERQAGDGRDHSASTGRPTEKPSEGSAKAAQGPAAHAIGLDDAELAAEANI